MQNVTKQSNCITNVYETISLKEVEEVVLAWGTLQMSLAYTKKIVYQVVSREDTG